MIRDQETLQRLRERCSRNMIRRASA